MKWLALAMVIVTSVGYTQESSHFELALEFDRLSGAQDKGKLVDSILPGILPPGSGTEEQREQLRQGLTALFGSEEYLRGKADVYMSIYSEAELKELIELVQSPAYQLLQERRYEINSGLITHMQGLLEKYGEELITGAPASPLE